MTPLKRGLIATVLATVTVSTLSLFDAEVGASVAHVLSQSAQWRDAATIRFAEPGALAVLGFAAVLLGIVGARRRAS